MKEFVVQSTEWGRSNWFLLLNWSYAFFPNRKKGVKSSHSQPVHPALFILSGWKTNSEMSVGLFAFVYTMKHLQMELWWFSGQRRMQLGQDEKRSTKIKGMRTWDGRLQRRLVRVECKLSLNFAAGQNFEQSNSQTAICNGYVQEIQEWNKHWAPFPRDEILLSVSTSYNCTRKTKILWKNGLNG